MLYRWKTEHWIKTRSVMSNPDDWFNRSNSRRHFKIIALLTEKCETIWEKLFCQLLAKPRLGIKCSCAYTCTLYIGCNRINCYHIYIYIYIYIYMYVCIYVFSYLYVYFFNKINIFYYGKIIRFPVILLAHKSG